MKNLRILSTLLIVTITALAAVAFTSRWLTQQSGSSITKIAVAVTNTDPGQRLLPEATRLVDWPASNLSPRAINDPHALDGRTVRTSPTRGEPMLDSELTPVGTAGGLSVVIAEGRCAITVRINDVADVMGFVLLGSCVDIVVNTQQDSREAKPGADCSDQSIPKIVLEKILALAVAQKVNRDDTKLRIVNAVTLGVTLEQAEKIDLARSVGNLPLALHDRVDSQHNVTAGATKNTPLKEPVVSMTVAVPVVKTVQIVHRVAERRFAGNCVDVINDMQHSQECF